MGSPIVDLRPLSNSSTKTWRRCPKQYEFKYIMDLKPKKKSVHLERGSWLHELLELHYDGEDWWARHLELTHQFNMLFEEEREGLGDLPSEVERIMRGYILRYKEEDKHYRVIDSELDEIITLPNGLRFRMIIDLVMEEPDGGIWLWDHKTVGGFMPVEFMLIDSQLSRYFWGANYLGYKPLRGILFNELITKPPTVPEVLKSGGLTVRQNLKTDYITYYRELKRHGLDPKEKKYRAVLKRLKARDGDWFRRTRLPKSDVLTTRMMNELTMTAREILNAQDKNAYPRTPDKSCVWGCDFLGPCQMQLQGADISAMIKQSYESRTPKKEDV